MKYRDIAKAILLQRARAEPIRANDAASVPSLNEGRDEFTPKQVKKIQEALNEMTGKMRTKWKVED